LGHNKVLVLDNRWMLTGSFNWSEAANSRNAENLLLIDNPSLAKIYAENWEKRIRSASVSTIFKRLW